MPPSTYTEGENDRGPLPCDILLLDGENRAALAATRALGKQGFRVAVASDACCALASASRFCTQSFLLPSVRSSNPKIFLKRVGEILTQHEIPLLLPISDLSCRIIAENRSLLPDSLRVLGIDGNDLSAVIDKGKLLQRASYLGIAIPRTLGVSSAILPTDDVQKQLREFQFPAVLKPESSEQHNQESFRKAELRYVNNIHEVETFLLKSENENLRFLLQEQIVGVGVGVFALCDHGQVLASFCHRRILEKPPSGGRSVLSESIPEADAPVKESKALLQSLQWHGVAMVEFKQGQDGRFYLMEINPRLWGSLQLAIDCGRDFPTLLCALIRGDLERHLPLPPYLVGRRLRWDLGCLDHFLIQLKQAPIQTIRSLFFKNSLKFFGRPGQTSHETFCFTDPLPFVYELLQYARDLCR